MTRAAQPLRLAATLAISCVLIALFTGCGHRTKKEAARACNKAKLALLTAISHGDFAEARRLRAGAYRDCTDRSELSALDLKIADGESKRQSREALAAARARQRDEFVRFFLEFVREHRSAPNEASARARCDAPSLTATDAAMHAAMHSTDAAMHSTDAAMHSTDAAKATDAATRGNSGGDGAGVRPRFCTAQRLVSNQRAFEIRYEADDPGAFRFTTSVDGALDCAALGARPTKTWSVSVPGGGTSPRESCSFDGPLAGLVAVAGGGNASSLHVFSPRYLEREPGARAILDAPSR